MCCSRVAIEYVSNRCERQNNVNTRPAGFRWAVLLSQVVCTNDEPPGLERLCVLRPLRRQEQSPVNQMAKVLSISASQPLRYLERFAMGFLTLIGCDQTHTGRIDLLEAVNALYSHDHASRTCVIDLSRNLCDLNRRLVNSGNPGVRFWRLRILCPQYPLSAPSDDEVHDRQSLARKRFYSDHFDREAS